MGSLDSEWNGASSGSMSTGNYEMLICFVKNCEKKHSSLFTGSQVVVDFGVIDQRLYFALA